MGVHTLLDFKLKRTRTKKNNTESDFFANFFMLFQNLANSAIKKKFVVVKQPVFTVQPFECHFWGKRTATNTFPKVDLINCFCHSRNSNFFLWSRRQKSLGFRSDLNQMCTFNLKYPRRYSYERSTCDMNCT